TPLSSPPPYLCPVPSHSSIPPSLCFLLFLFTAPPPSPLSPLSLHDALPISAPAASTRPTSPSRTDARRNGASPRCASSATPPPVRPHALARGPRATCPRACRTR